MLRTPLTCARTLAATPAFAHPQHDLAALDPPILDAPVATTRRSQQE